MQRTLGIGIFLLVLTLALSPLGLALSGCAVLSRTKYAQVQDTYIATVQVLITAKQTGEFTDEEWQEDILPLIVAGDLLLDQYDAVTRTGVNADTLLFQIRDILAALRPFLVRAGG